MKTAEDQLNQPGALLTPKPILQNNPTVFVGELGEPPGEPPPREVLWMGSALDLHRGLYADQPPVSEAVAMLMTLRMHLDQSQRLLLSTQSSS